MRKLIDGTIQALPLSNYILERKDTFIRVLEKRDNDFLFGMLINYFYEQPTACDLDRVVEQLEELKAYALYENMNADTKWLDRAVEIVKKAGGIE